MRNKSICPPVGIVLFETSYDFTFSSKCVRYKLLCTLKTQLKNYLHYEL